MHPRYTVFAGKTCLIRTNNFAIAVEVYISNADADCVHDALFGMIKHTR